MASVLSIALLSFLKLTSCQQKLKNPSKPGVFLLCALISLIMLSKNRPWLVYNQIRNSYVPFYSIRSENQDAAER